jgi:dTDP-4-dehydrorhamnose 3,5-epimerase
MTGVQIRGLAVEHAFSVHPQVFDDDRGSFHEWYRHDLLTEAVGHPLDLRQANCSVSRRGVLRGIHLTDVPPGQAKYVTCVRGAVLDLVVDLRIGSPGFGTWDAVRLDEQNRAAVYVAEGLGHAFVALEDGATVVYLCSSSYDPAHDRGVHPLDPRLGLTLPDGLTPVLSEKDAAAPTVADAVALGWLPTYADCLARYAELQKQP